MTRVSPALLLAPLLALALCAAPRDAHAQDDDTPAVTPQRLRDDLDQGAVLFRRNPDLSAARAYAASEAYVDVEWQGKTISVRDPWLADRVEGLAALPPEEKKKAFTEIANHLSARAAEVDAQIAAAPKAGASPTGTPPPDPDQVLRGVLGERQFHAETEDPRLAQAAAKVRDTVRAGWEKVKEFARNLFNPPSTGNTWLDRLRRWGAILVAAVAVIGALVLVVYALMRATADEAKSTAEEDLPTAPPKPEVMMAAAERLAAAGDRRGAVRALYLALLGDLHAQGAIVYDRHRTNREYLRTMRLDAIRAAAFTDAVELFDRKWYGREECAAEELELFKRLVLRARTAEALAA
ncbi:MAG TPA: DUF4129 domain-containing protein [bacterium]|nr:DUF4129 domain-containing protein [bacterium]